MLPRHPAAVALNRPAVVMEMRNICNHPLIRWVCLPCGSSHVEAVAASFSRLPQLTAINPCRFVFHPCSRMHPEGAELALPAHPLPAEVRQRGSQANAATHSALSRLLLLRSCACN